VKDQVKLVSEGVEGQVPYRGRVGAIMHQLAGGWRAAMGYVGAETIPEFQQKARFIRITSAGFRESHVHDVTVARESPNPSGAWGGSSVFLHVIFELGLGVERLRRRSGDCGGRGRRGAGGETGKNSAGGKDARNFGHRRVLSISACVLALGRIAEGRDSIKPARPIDVVGPYPQAWPSTWTAWKAAGRRSFVASASEVCSASTSAALRGSQPQGQKPSPLWAAATSR
jgi:hypothetical protein